MKEDIFIKIIRKKLDDIANLLDLIEMEKEVEKNGKPSN